MNLDCTTPLYEELYARWLWHEDGLLDRAQMKAGDKVLDLCGGTGVISRQALDLGALEVVLLDLAPRAFHLKHLYPLFCQRRGRAEEVATLFPKHYFDIIVCRQAIGYLDPEQVAQGVFQVLRPGGRFVFNTFKRPRWLAKTYRMGGTRFFEAAGYLGDHVVHLQAGWGLGIDVTKFRWHRDLKTTMGRYFSVHEETRGNSLYYTCHALPAEG